MSRFHALNVVYFVAGMKPKRGAARSRSCLLSICNIQFGIIISSAILAIVNDSYEFATTSDKVLVCVLVSCWIPVDACELVITLIMRLKCSQQLTFMKVANAGMTDGHRARLRQTALFYAVFTILISMASAYQDVTVAISVRMLGRRLAPSIRVSAQVSAHEVYSVNCGIRNRGGTWCLASVGSGLDPPRLCLPPLHSHQLAQLLIHLSF